MLSAEFINFQTTQKMKSLKIVLICAFSMKTITLFSQEKAGKKDTAQHTTLYTCPTHSEVNNKKPGHCPKCGMKLELSTKEQMKTDVTKNYVCPIHTDVSSNKAGKCPKCDNDLVLSPKEKMKMEAVGKYSCSMHPDVTSDNQGKCPKCNMDLVETKKEEHSDHH